MFGQLKFDILKYITKSTSAQEEVSYLFSLGMACRVEKHIGTSTQLNQPRQFMLQLSVVRNKIVIHKLHFHQSRSSLDKSRARFHLLVADLLFTDSRKVRSI